jgi:lysophospholipase L1-like esterase
MSARYLAWLLALAAGCGEGVAVKGPPMEPATAPRVARVDSLAIATATPTATAIPTATSTPTSTPTSPLATPPLPPVGHLDGWANLSRLFSSLATVDDGHAHDDVRIVQFGDSHTACDVGTSAFRHLLQARFGDGGRGFVSVGRPWKNYWQDGIRGGMQDFEPAKVTFKDRRFVGDGRYGLLGVGIDATRGGARAWTEVASRFSRVEIDYWQEPQGGSFDVLVDGAKHGRVATQAAQASSGFYALDLPDAPHQIELRTVGDGEVRVFGMALDRSRAGVVVDALGVNGAQVSTLLREDEDHFVEQLRHRAPDLVVLAFGTNEALDPLLTDADYERKLVDLLGRVERAAPSASCLLLGPPDLARRAEKGKEWKTWPRVVEISAAQRRVAEAARCAYYDQLEAMGGPGSMAAWAAEPESRGSSDRVHLRKNGYTQLGTSFAVDLMRAYDEWRAEKGMPPTSAPATWMVGSR